MNKNKLSIKPADIVTLVSILVIGLVIYFLAIPQSDKLKQNTANLTSKNNKLAQLQEEKANLLSLQQLLPNYQREINLLDIAFPKTEQSVEGMIQLQSIAERAGMTLTSVVPGKGAAGKLPITAIYRGPYNSASLLLKEFVRNIRPIIVQSVAVTKDTGQLDTNGLPKTGSDTVLVSVKLNFGYNNDGASGAAGTPVTTVTPAATP